ncbi:unnamed protein product [Microthlaspi erraticum]|uniref:Uncharacterized protein n=1 Tax=Microthlaspi erraticum TaxID=1685480 RepID=A0A6D2JQG4_9BRAS|nr:unnamed protein product [Microthlaspi erraticum]
MENIDFEPPIETILEQGQEEEDYAHPGAAGEGESSGDVENLMDYKTGEFHFKNHEIKGRKSAANTALESINTLKPGTSSRTKRSSPSSRPNLNQEEEGLEVTSSEHQRVIPHHPPPQILSERYSELMARSRPEVMIGDGPEGDRSNRMAKQARRNRALSKRKQSA